MHRALNWLIGFLKKIGMLGLDVAELHQASCCNGKFKDYAVISRKGSKRCFFFAIICSCKFATVLDCLGTGQLVWSCLLQECSRSRKGEAFVNVDNEQHFPLGGFGSCEMKVEV